MSYRFLDCSNGEIAVPVEPFIGKAIATACANTDDRQIILVFSDLSVMGVQWLPALGLHALAITTGHIPDEKTLRTLREAGTEQNLASVFTGQTFAGISRGGVFEFGSGLQVRFDERGILVRQPSTVAEPDHHAPAD